MINQIKTIILLGTLGALFIFVGNSIGGPTGIVCAFIFAIIINGGAYFFSDRLVLKMYNAQPLNPSTHSAVHSITQELTQEMNIPLPALWIINTPMANAFATGRSPAHASVAVTTGILDLLDYAELRGVIAHELAHIKNRDTLITTVAATLAAAISYLANMAYYIPFFNSSENSKKKSINPFVFFIILCITPLAATLLQLALSRSREFEADKVGASSCHNPHALASALEKINLNVARATIHSSQNPLYTSTASLFIVNPLTTREWLTTLFSTHPPLKERVARLYAMNEK